MELGFIGTGRIARRLVRGLAGDGHGLRVTPRSAAVAEALAADPGANVGDDAQDVVDASDVVFLCLPAPAAREVLPGLAFRAEQAVISVMGEVGLRELRGLAAPAGEIAITIPMPFVEQGGCPLPVYPESPALAATLGVHNPVIPVADEAALEPFWAVAGSVASVLAELDTIAGWLGERIGDRQAAERYVVALYGGYLGTLATDGDGRLEEALGELSLEGGLNATLRERIAASGHPENLRAGLEALLARVRG